MKNAGDLASFQPYNPCLTATLNHYHQHSFRYRDSDVGSESEAMPTEETKERLVTEQRKEECYFHSFDVSYYLPVCLTLLTCGPSEGRCKENEHEG